jgi:hypothetical protein
VGRRKIRREDSNALTPSQAQRADRHQVCPTGRHQVCPVKEGEGWTRQAKRDKARGQIKGANKKGWFNKSSLTRESRDLGLTRFALHSRAGPSAPTRTTPTATGSGILRVLFPSLLAPSCSRPSSFPLAPLSVPARVPRLDLLCPAIWLS